MICLGQIEKMKYALRILNRHWSNVPKHTDISTFCAAVGLVRTIQSQVAERVMRVKKAVSGPSFDDSRNYSGLTGLSGRMCPDFSLSTMGKTFGELYPTSMRLGIVWRGQCWTPSHSAFPKGGGGYSLSRVLETSAPPKYYLSRRAMAGILRRSLKSNQSGYVFRQETGPEETPRLKPLSLIQLWRLIMDGLPSGDLVTKAISSPHTLSQQTFEDVLATSRTKILLRKLTPTEKERLQGFPEGWTLPEGLSLATPSLCPSQNGSGSE